MVMSINGNEYLSTEEDGRKLKNIYINLILTIIFSLYLKFGIFKWKCDFILSLIIHIKYIKMH